MNQREKEAYLREYSLMKAEGKPFFPYAVAKDSLMGVIVIAIPVPPTRSAGRSTQNDSLVPRNV